MKNRGSFEHTVNATAYPEIGDATKQWRIQDFPEVRALTLQGGGRQHTILPNSPKNCMKLKEFGPLGARPGQTLLDRDPSGQRPPDRKPPPREIKSGWYASYCILVVK